MAWVIGLSARGGAYHPEDRGISSPIWVTRNFGLYPGFCDKLCYDEVIVLRAGYDVDELYAFSAPRLS